jgi:hypothetical protein
MTEKFQPVTMKFKVLVKDLCDGGTIYSCPVLQAGIYLASLGVPASGLVINDVIPGGAWRAQEKQEEGA